MPDFAALIATDVCFGLIISSGNLFLYCMSGKKVLILFVALLALFLATTYLLFPAQQQAGGSVLSGANYSMAIRQLPDTVLWKRWWPWSEPGKEGNQPEGTIRLKGFSDTQLVLDWEEHGVFIPVAVTLSSKGNDSTILLWSAGWEVGANPIARISEFARGRRLRNDMQTLLAAFSIYASNPENVYGFKPVYTKVTDTLLISTKSTFTVEPGLKEIYGMFGSLEKYVVANGATITGQPMYHVTGSGNAFEVMTALPISKLIEESGSYRIKRMVDGHLLVAEVKAGPEVLKLLFRQFEQYKNDYRLASPAIPYLQPITNRMQNPDTAQWITRMCYPIF